MKKIKESREDVSRFFFQKSLFSACNSVREINCNLDSRDEIGENQSYLLHILPSGGIIQTHHLKIEGGSLRAIVSCR